MKDRICKDKPISSEQLVDYYLKEILKKEKPKSSNLYDKWDVILPENLKKHIQIKEIRDDVLILVADHPAWRQKANMNKRKILKKINEEFPTLNIKSIQIICR